MLYVICAGFGFIPSPEGPIYWVLMFFSLLFFVPPTMILYRAIKTQEKQTLRCIRNLSLISLSATLLAIILNIFSVAFTKAAGTAVYWILIVVSSPMICAQVWAISLFLWACLLMTALQQLRKK